MSEEKTARPELGTYQNPKWLAESRPEPLFKVIIQYNGYDTPPTTLFASGVDLRDGNYLIAKPRLVTRYIQGEWHRFWSNEVFKFVNIVEVVDVTIEHMEE